MTRNLQESRGATVAITWEEHRRTRGISSRLNVPLIELSYKGGRLARYRRLTFKTYRALRATRPRTLMVQNPSLVLALWALMLRPLFRYKLIVDAHNEAVSPFIHDRWVIRLVAKFLLRKADLTIVTNKNLASYVERAGGRAFVLPDPLPDVASKSRAPDPALGLDVMVVCTYAPDEPVREILAAASQVGERFRFHVTGNSAKLDPSLKDSIPPNVRLTGFLPEHDYWKLMETCHLVLDLTLMPDCLVCGAYEALAMCRPMILSDNLASKELFGDVAVLSKCTVEDIVRALDEMHRRFDELRDAAVEQNATFGERWTREAAKLVSKMSLNG